MILMRPLGWLASGLALFAVSPPLYASDCGVSRVDRTRTGVKVSFSKATKVTVNRPGVATFKVTVDPAAARGATSSKEGPVDAIAGSLGDQMFVTWSNHSGCVMVIATRGDEIGILETVGISAPGLPPWQKSNFVPAR